MSIPHATHRGKLVIGPVSLACFVLGDGTRLLGQDTLVQVFTPSGTSPASIRAPDHPPPFLAYENLKPFICDALLESCTPVEFYTESGATTYGYRAEILPGVCNVYLSARDAGVLLKDQESTAQQADVLVRSLAQLGIIALIDEATGYQESCDRLSSKALLERFFRPFEARWTKRFPDEYYEELFRLRGWEWQGMQVNRPPIIGHYTNDIVYARITDNLLDQLRLVNPKNGEGGREHRHHQWLTDDFGVQELREHLVGVMALMRSVQDTDPKRAWEKFYRRLQRSYPRKNTNYNLDLDE